MSGNSLDAASPSRGARLRQAIRPRQFLAYLGVGLVGTGGHYLTLVALVRWARLDPVVATTCGFAVGAIINYSPTTTSPSAVDRDTRARWRAFS
jgi:hypothetical protein